MKRTSLRNQPSESRDLLSLKSLQGYSVHADDGSIGRIADFFFDDIDWTIRYFVVEIDSHNPKRLVLVSPIVFNPPKHSTHTVDVGLSREQLAKSPPYDPSKPLSRQQEAELHAYYSWPPYWPELKHETDEKPADSPLAEAEIHLHRTSEMAGYRLEAENGVAGHVDDFLVEANVWIIRSLVVKTEKAIPGPEVLISTDKVKNVNHRNDLIEVSESLEAIKSSPPYNPRDFSRTRSAEAVSGPSHHR